MYCQTCIDLLQLSSFKGNCQKEMEACLKHLEGFNKSLSQLVEGNEKIHNQVDKWAKEIGGLEKRVLELEA